MPDSQLRREKLIVNLQVRDTYPRNETLEKAGDTAASPDGMQCLRH